MAATDQPDNCQFLADIRRNPINVALLDRLPALDLADCWLVAGCLFQTVWNLRSGRPAAENIRDYDVFYFDGSDLSYEAEDRVIKRVATAFADVDATIEVKNQARVHLWYRQRFGHDYPQLTSSQDGIDRFQVECTCVGISCNGGERAVVYAPNGYDDLYAGILTANMQVSTSRFNEKALNYQSRWPHLKLSERTEAGAK
jgi:uncharacterized protein